MCTSPLLAIILTISPPHSPSHGQDLVYQLVADLPASVREVRSAGRWRADTGSGVYRVIVVRGGYEKYSDLLFIQWIRVNVNGEPDVVATVGVKEVNDDGPVTLTHSLRAEGTNRLTITLNTHHSASGQRAQVILVATTPTKYSATRRALAKGP